MRKNIVSVRTSYEGNKEETAPRVIKAVARSISNYVSRAWPVDSLLRVIGSGTATVLMLHRIECRDRQIRGHTREMLIGSLELLRKRRFSLLSIDDVVEHIIEGRPLPERAVCFTLDDGYIEQADIAGEVFARYDCPATFFLTTGFVDGECWQWDARLSYSLSQSSASSVVVPELDVDRAWPLRCREDRNELFKRIVLQVKEMRTSAAADMLKDLERALGIDVPRDPPAAFAPMSWEDARALERRGMFIGAHGATHCILSRSQSSQCLREMVVSQTRIGQEVSRPSSVFCFPSGRQQDFTRREMMFAYTLGFKGALSSCPGYLSLSAGTDELFAIPRFGFPDTISELDQYVSGIERVKSFLRS